LNSVVLPLFGSPTIPTSSAIAASGYSAPLRAEADLRPGRVPLEVHDPGHDDGQAAVDGVELQSAAGARADRALDRIGRLRLDGRGDDLPAVEGELDANRIVRQGTPPP